MSSPLHSNVKTIRIPSLSDVNKSSLCFGKINFVNVWFYHSDDILFKYYENLSFLGEAIFKSAGNSEACSYYLDVLSEHRLYEAYITPKKKLVLCIVSNEEGDIIISESKKIPLLVTYLYVFPTLEDLFCSGPYGTIPAAVVTEIIHNVSRLKGETDPSVVCNMDL